MPGTSKITHIIKVAVILINTGNIIQHANMQKCEWTISKFWDRSIKVRSNWAQSLSYSLSHSYTSCDCDSALLIYQSDFQKQYNQLYHRQ